MKNFIEPRVLKGFRDFLPAQEIERRHLTEIIEKNFRSFGFVPIDTPALEYADILLGKMEGEINKQVYRFADNGGRDVALRFDLTVPFARFCAEHYSELVLPFKRYHIAKVWRGENTQRGRYREFTQCDADIVGTKSLATDAEIILLMRQTILALLQGGGITIKINHRGLFNRFLSELKLGEKSADVLRAVDKLAKTGEEAVMENLIDISGKAEAEKIMRWVKAKDLEELIALTGGPSDESNELGLLFKYFTDAGISDAGQNGSSLVLDPSITRGLDYYTGIVFETFLNEMPEIGSICSGGRYDNLAALYTKENLPGVGASIGLDRLIAALDALQEKQGKPANQTGFADCAILCSNEDDAGKYQALAKRFRDAGLAVTVFTEAKKPVQQYIQAEKQGIPWVLTIEETGLSLREIATRQDYKDLSAEEAIKTIKK
ncbi:MAG: histidine--tRNA ligase [Spirochaetaceae bacterium]|jgi:histidyl-tRNA synthetase|nr:histidine--tRNA ligase [Spirochaetaceae bacterium]